MNYVYDILLNFNERFYDFYDWNVRDLIDHMRKIPIFKVSKNVLEDFLNYDIKIEKEFLDKVQDKAEIFWGRKVKNISYAFLLTDCKKVIGFKLKDNQLLISDLLLDEEEVALEMVPLLNETKILYSKKNIFNKQNFKTRKEEDLEKNLKKALIHLEDEQNIERLKYIYLSRIPKVRKNAGGNYYTNIIASNSKNFAIGVITDTLNGYETYKDAINLLDIKSVKAFNRTVKELGI